MGAKLVVLDSKEVPGVGQVVQGKLEVEGQDVLGFLVQPNLETVFWSLPDGATLRDPEQTRGVLSLMLMAVLEGGVTGLEPPVPLSTEEFTTTQQAWRLGLTHGWSAAQNGDRQVAANHFAYLWDMIWPNQLTLPNPEIG